MEKIDRLSRAIRTACPFVAETTPQAGALGCICRNAAAADKLVSWLTRDGIRCKRAGKRSVAVWAD
jgi:hypothetical protein